MKHLLLIFILFALSPVVDAQKAYRNENYKKVKKEEFKIFLTPYFSPGAGYINDIFFNTFNQGQFSVVDTGKMAYKILNLATFNKSMRIVTNINFDASYIKKQHNLYTLLTQDEIQDFKDNCLNADIIIICSKIDARKVTKVNGSGNIAVSGKIAVYDISTGEFIALCSNSVKKKHDDLNTTDKLPVEELVEGLFKSFEENY